MSDSMNKNVFIHFLPVFGCVSTALIYTAVGVLAMLSFFRIVDGGADEGSLVVLLDEYPIGKFLIGILLAGTLCYIIWRIYESINDPYNYGNKIKGLTIRTGIALSSLADGLLAYSIIRVLLHQGNIQQNGEPTEEREFVSSLLQIFFGQAFVITIGVALIITALLQLIYGITNGYKERMNSENFYPAIRKLIPPFAWIGFISRGVILGIVGIFYMKAGILKNEQYIINTDKAFDFIGDNIGHIYFIVVALGTICYGIFTFALGMAYDCDKD